MTADERFMVDGALRSADEVRRIFRPEGGVPPRLSIRQRVAARMVGRAGKRGRLLDVGCYAGTFLDAMGRLYPELELTGVDAYPDNIRIARLLYPERASSFRCESVYALDLPDASFDFVTFLEVLEHVDRPVDAVRQLNRVIAPGGHIVLSTPNGVSARHVLHT
ncbi:MAG: methyltransferase domain-containing protein, partial [Elusimicrobia bacterium]|nr:methyltransferase domain-containing protein [Elusimicrobiota bacterium]